MPFEDLEVGERYTVIGGANDTFLLGAICELSKDGEKIYTSNAGFVNGCAQSGWIGVDELEYADYAGVVFKQHVRDGWFTQ